MELPIKTYYQIIIGLLVCSFFVAGCGRIQQQTSSDNPNYILKMKLEPTTPSLGPSRLIFTLTDSVGQSIDNATLEIEGNMTHAGMIPVLAQSTTGQNGQYSVPFEWTMSGDWIVTVQVTLADGETFAQQFPVGVQ